MLKNNRVSHLDRIIADLVAGRLYTYSTDFVLAADTTSDFLIRTYGSDCYIRVANVNAFGAEVAVYGYSGSTVSADGTEVFFSNQNLQSDKTATTKLFTGPTVTDAGDEITRNVAFTSSSWWQARSAVSAEAGSFLLNKRTDHIFRLVNRSANNDAKVVVRLETTEVNA